mgnify:FL=1
MTKLSTHHSYYVISLGIMQESNTGLYHQLHQNIYTMQGDFRSVAKERRSKIQLYYDIVSAIVEDSQNNDSVSPTRIQFKCNTSYDKLTKYLEEMKERQIIAQEKSIKLTDKGMKFHHDYSKINELILDVSKQIKAE